jgi:hypothetical protein
MEVRRMRKFAKALVVPAVLAVFAVGCDTDDTTHDDPAVEQQDDVVEDDGMDDTDDDF